MKTQISLKEDKFFWEQKKYPNKYDGNLHWILTQEDMVAVIYKDTEGLWRLDPTRGLGNIFDTEIRFKRDVSAQQYVENKLLKWLKSIIMIKV